MPHLSSLPVRPLLLLLAGAVATQAAPAPIVTPTITFYPLENAPYSAAATVAPEAAKIFVSGSSGADATAALAGLANGLRLAGASPADLANVRGSLILPAGAPFSMDAWNAAWGHLLAGVAHRPTRTTLGVTALADPAHRVLAEGVAARPLDPAAPLPGEAAPNPFVRQFGSGPYGSAAATLVLPGTALVFTAGILADPADPSRPENTVARYGDMAAQTQSALAKLEQTLAEQGLRWEDIFYVRALLSPPPGEAAVDFAGFGRAFAAAFGGRNPAHRPALTAWAAPGFNVTGRIVEIEVYAAAADRQGPFARAGGAGAHPSLRMTGAPAAAISSSGAVAPGRALTWFAGVVGTAGSMHDEGVTALLSLRARAAAAGTSFADAVQMRSYPVVGDDFTGQFALWNEAYARFFNLPGLNPHKPARTAFPVPSLPQDRRIEIEIITVGR